MVRIKRFPDAPHVLVASTGNIYRSYDHKDDVKLVPSRVNPQGYKYVNIKVNGKVTPKTVARIVCRTFHGPPPTPQHTVDHKNRIQTDNRASNLRWATMSEQARNRATLTYVRHHPPIHTRQVHQLDLQTGAVLATFASALEAATAVLDSAAPPLQCKDGSRKISEVIRGKRRQWHGFKWSSTHQRSVADEKGEEWRDVPLATRGMQVSSHGRVKRICLHATSQDELVHCPVARRLTTTAEGYFQLMYGLQSIDSGTVRHVCTRVHQLVAAAFIGPRPPGLVVIHLDGDHENNMVNNLAYAGRSSFRKRKRETANE